jgi:undecaprenyl-diphosphatase
VDLLHLIILSLIQGLTEFLPISSSAHLILPSLLLGWEDQGLIFDITAHLGSLLAVIIYMRAEIKKLSIAWLYSLTSRVHTPESRLSWCIILSTIPAGLAGLFFGNLIEQHLRTIHVIAITTIVFGLILGIADFKALRTKNINEFTWKAALFVGFAQTLALIPGTSRSGITITAGLLLGFKRTAAAKFSFLLAIPIILLSGLYKITKLTSDNNINWEELGLATAVSFVTAYVCLNFFISVINKIGMVPFVIYRLVLGITLLILSINI